MVVPLTTLTVVSLAGCVLLIARLTWGYERIAGSFGAVVTLALAVEAVGVATGWPFGDYDYTNRLPGQLFGVPVVVALAWFAMGLPAWEVGRRLSPGNRWFACLIGGTALAGWDIFLDPQMTENEFWIWPDGGVWQGIPASNYLGWFATGTLVMVVLNRLLDFSAPPAPLLTLAYFWMVGAETLGFALPFAFDRPIVAVVGGAVTLPLAWLAHRSYRQSVADMIRR